MSFKKMTIHTTFVFVLFNVSAMIRLFYLNIWINQISRQNVKQKYLSAGNLTGLGRLCPQLKS